MRSIIGLAGAAAILSVTPLVSSQTVYPRGVTISNAFSWQGLTMFGHVTGEAILVDQRGSLVQKWSSPFPGERLSFVEPLPNGRVLAVSGGGGALWKVVELDHNGQLIWSVTAPAGVTPHHDLVRLESGNTLYLGHSMIDVPEISPITLQDDCIVEVNPAGQVVWRWDSYMHFAEFGFNTLARQLISAQGGDWAHANSIQVLPANNHGGVFKKGNILVSQRHTNTVFIIEPRSGAIVWKLGPNNNLTYGQHHAHMIAPGLPGAGNILIYDNGAGTGYPVRGRARVWTRVIELDPATENIVWEYSAANSGRFQREFFSDITGSAQRLPNGNTLIIEGVDGRIFEVDPTGKIVWEYISPFDSPLAGSPGVEFKLIYRAYRLPLNWAPDTSGLQPDQGDRGGFGRSLARIRG